MIELKGRWNCAELRRAAAEVLVDAARQVKVLRTLSLRLAPVVAGGEGELGRDRPSLGLVPKSQPQPPGREPPVRAPPVPQPPAPRREESTPPVAEPDPEESYTYEYSEGSGSVHSEREEVPTPSKRVAAPPPPVPPPVPEVKEELSVERKEKARGSKGEPARSSKQKTRRSERGEKDRHRGRRGGRKHQQSHRRRHDPSIRIHKRRGVSELKRLREDFPDLPRPPPWSHAKGYFS